jgi:hypothetical protein
MTNDILLETIIHEIMHLIKDRTGGNTEENVIKATHEFMLEMYKKDLTN